MDGVHDLGGKSGFGAVLQTPSERGAYRGFEQRWHAVVHAIINTLLREGIAHNVDRFRHAIERIDPTCYLSDGYYGRWLGAAETLLVEANQLSIEAIDAAARDLADEFVARESLSIAAQTLGTAPSAARPAAYVEFDYDAEGYAVRALDTAPRFLEGDRVITRTAPSLGHTRLPEYARGKVGRVQAHHGGWVLPDTNAHGLGESPTHLYTIAFDARTLWGDSASEPNTSVCLDLFESYLQPFE